ncbi:cupin domain-containing protein [Pedobacter immunditicola]|uniref:cupin domain-containing protein n=1 Tax=Pedobacter immunditicola TaxID=3133440 RepID=UPI0030A97C7C
MKEQNSAALFPKGDKLPNEWFNPKGQVLIVTEGEGFYQKRGKPAQRIKRGDVVIVPENVEHLARSYSDQQNCSYCHYKL